MESLYTKYRPQTFEQVVGQGHVVETLKRAVLEGRTSHAYLFCGPRGTGKTTMARILAKALLCEKGPGALPDGTCEQCSLIAASEHPDVIELDAASRTGVDNVREEIISRVSYAPVRGRAKVYIIDEVHMLTPAAFNALLKTLEEPPEHVVFIMCTTDPQKILATILSRVQRFDFHAIGNDEMQAHLAYVCGQEGFSYEQAALELIVRHARGGMRDALTALEQLSVFGAGEISLAAAQEMLGEVSGAVLGEVATAIARRDTASLFAQVAQLADAGRDPLQFTRELAAHLRDVYVASVTSGAAGAVSASAEELDALRAEAAAFGTSDRLARALTVLGDASNEMRTATNQRLVLEIALTRLARPETDLTLEALAERVADLERQVAILSVPGALAGLAPAVEKTLEQMPAAPEPPSPPVVLATPVNVPVAPVEKPAPAVAPSATSPIASRAASEERSDERRADGRGRARGDGAGNTGLSNGNLQRAWKQVVDTLVAQSPQKGALLLSSTAVSDDGEKLMVSLPKGSHFASRMLERQDVREIVGAVVSQHVGRRQVIYVESSLASQAISHAESVAAPPVVPAPAPAPAPEPQPAPEPAPAPAPAPAAPAPEPDYPKPWDDPVPVSDPVPYTDADVTPYEDDSISAPDPAPAAPDAPTPAMPATAPAAPVPAADGSPVALDASRAGSDERSEERRAGEGDGGAVGSGDPALTPEFADIAARLSAAFGQPLSMSVESAATTSDEDAAAELAREEGFSADEGFTDEPVEDGEDED